MELPPNLVGTLVALAIALWLAYRLALSHAAVSAVSRTRVRALAEEGSRTAERLGVLLARRDGVQASLRLGFSLCVVAVAVAGWWLARMRPAGLQPVVVGWIAMAALSLGAELVPRLKASVRPETVALRQVGWVTFVYRVLGPLARFVQAEESPSTAKEREEQEEDAAESIRELVDTTPLRPTQRRRITEILEFPDKTVAEVMVPRIDMIGVSAAAPLAEVATAIVDSGYSRLPVFGETKDDIVGLAHARDVLSWLPAEGTAEQVARKPLFVSETARLDLLLRDLRTHKSSMAIVVDEYGGTAGLVTVEDIIEEIVGEIHDETDTAEESIRKRPGGGWLVAGRAELETLADVLHLPVDRDDAVNTAGGLMMAMAGDVPEPGEVAIAVLDEDRLVLLCEELDGPRIGELALLVQPLADDDDEEKDVAGKATKEAAGSVMAAGGSLVSEVDELLALDPTETGEARVGDLFAFWPAGGRTGQVIRWRSARAVVLADDAETGLLVRFEPEM